MDHCYVFRRCNKMKRVMDKLVFPLYFNCSIHAINAANNQISLQTRCKAFIYASKKVRRVLFTQPEEKEDNAV
jgi:hypothetical protein